jgi:hypothetical protein
MKFFLLLFAAIFSNHIFADQTCSSSSALAVPREIKNIMQFFGKHGIVFTAKKDTAADGKFETLLPMFKIGETIETKDSEFIKLEYFIPIQASIIIGPNSKIKILAVPTEKCGSSIEIISGTVVADGDHQKLNVEECPPDSVTNSAEIKCLGTKYSVDLSSAIAEASGEPIQEENYAVEKGSIQIKLKRAVSGKKSRSIAKDGSFKLKARQKAKIKIYKKSQVADIEIIEP